MIVEIKQIGKYNDRDEKSEYGEYTMLPMSSRNLVIPQQANGKFITGLENDPETRERLEEVLGVNLSPTSSFWVEKFRLLFRLETGSMKKNTERPQDELFVIVAQANKILAPDRDTLKNDYAFKKNTIFYIFDKEAEVTRKARNQELNDEVSALMYNMRGNRDKMLFIAHAVGEFVTDAFRVEDLYTVLTKYKEKQKTPDLLEKFRDVLKQPNEALQARYYVRKAQEFGIIRYDESSNMFKFQERPVARVESELYTHFIDKKNVADLAALLVEVKEKL